MTSMVNPRVTSTHRIPLILTALTESTFIQLLRIYMEQLQILFRYNSVRGILTLFAEQLRTVPALHRAKERFLK